MQSSEITRLRLSNQLISRMAFHRPGEVVARLGAVQAQDFAGAKWALGLRLPGAADGSIERAFNEGEFLRTHLLRPTWHFVHPLDIRWMLELTAPRVHIVNGTMYRKLELDRTTLKRSDALLLKALRGGQYLTRDELRGVFQKNGINAAGTLNLAYLMMHAELEGLICSGPRRGKKFTYALLEERAPMERSLDREEALAELARRYFQSRGPASVHDFAKWSGLTIADARNGLEAIKTRLEHVKMDGQEYWFSNPGSPVKTESPAAYLLSVYDEYISGYKDHRFTVEEHIASNLWAMGNALTYIIVLNGQVIGTWKRKITKKDVAIETNHFRPLAEPELQAVRAAAHRYGEFLDLPVTFSKLDGQ
jgi:hypothetical protein